MKLAHISDIHFGRITLVDIVGCLVHEVNERQVDLVVISGDLTQRARRWQYEAAAEMIRSFSAPTLVVPGNHDVYPWWRPVSRMFIPLLRYRKYITKDLQPSFEMEGLAVLGINSAHGKTIKGGRVGPFERRAIVDFFSKRDPSDFKVLVLHHHLIQIKALGPHDVARKAERALEVASEVGVDLILCGHLHISHVEPLEIVPNKHRVVVASAGTATSSRGRGDNRQTNLYNLVEIGPDSFSIEERRYEPDARQFVSDAVTRFARLPSPPGGIPQT